MEKVIIYLHGFLSSPKSHKAQQTLAFVAEHYPQLVLEIPALGNYPQSAINSIEQVMLRHPSKAFCFMGSSLGGFLATYMQQKYGGKAVIINPAVRPYELLIDYLGEHNNPYTHEQFILEARHIKELINLDVQSISQPPNFWVLLQTGDETLDYRQALNKYKGATLTVEEGGDHSFQHFERFLPDIFRFLLQD